MTRKFFKLTLIFVVLFAFTGFVNSQTLRVSMQERVPAEWDKNAYSLVNRVKDWKPSETAIIICDMWDKHWCPVATKRFDELAIALNPVIDVARNKGVLIVHSPSGCMNYYKDFAQRKIMADCKDKDIAALIKDEKLPTESKIPFPIDASDDGCDCNPKSRVYNAWKKQTDVIPIKEQDIISESGEELGVYFKQHGIKNVILVGVATNMCVLHRPFGLRNMKRLGMNVVLMRDMTDTMYTSQKPPYVDHYSGTDLVVEYIETCVCPTIVSTDFTGQKQFRFAEDKRKRIAFLVAEGEYHANQRLPEFANELTLRNFSCDFSLGVPRMNGEGRHNIENLQILEDADLMILYVRRRALEAEKMAKVKKYVASGKPLFAIRTSAVAFDAQKPISNKQGNILEQWKEFDKDILGGNYQAYDSELRKQGTGTDVTIVSGQENHLLLKGVQPFHCQDWMYKNTPLRSDKAEILLRGKNPKWEEPVLWTNGDNVVYTSLGHWDDWKIESFKNLMFNTVNYLLKEKNQKEQTALK